MLNKTQRLSRQQISHLLRNGKSIRSSNLSAKIHPNNFSHNRYAVAISKKIVKKAVQRNQFRRQIYHVISQFETNQMANPSVLHPQQKHDLSIKIGPGFFKQNLTERAQNLLNFLHQINHKKNTFS